MESKNAVAALSALAQETRLAIFRLLVRQGPAGLAAGRIAERLGIPPNTLSFHLALLSQADLIESRREGRTVLYALREEGIRSLMAFLIEDCCKDHPELCCAAPPAPCCPTPTRKTRAASPSARSAKRPAKIGIKR